jgi:CheY-like chemotaxis protein
MISEQRGVHQPTKRKVVLVGDDDALVRLIAADVFEELGCEVLEAGSGAHALAILERRPDVWLMFSDCRMPGMSGPELARTAAARWPALRIVLATGYWTAPVLEFPVVQKPYSYRTLEHVVGGDARTRA